MKKIKMRHICLNLVLMASMLFSSAAFSQQLELFDGNGVPTMEASAKENFDPSFLRRLREEIQKEQIEEHRLSEKDPSYRGTLRNVNKRFVPESATFAIAGGGVLFMQMLIKTNSDPAAMVKQLESLKDPIAHVAFYSFMAANGVYINFKTKGMDARTKQQAMKTLQFKGMAVGSLASSLTADILTTFKECVTGWVNNKADEQSYAACDETLKTWTLRNKFTQYAPQILSLIVSQIGSDMVMDTTRIMKSKIPTSGLQKAEAATIKIFKISAASLDLAITAGGAVFVKSIAWVGKLTKFGTFLAVDHMITPSIMRMGNNILQPFFFQFDVNKLDDLMKSASGYNWNSEKALSDRSGCPPRQSTCHNFNALPKEVENFTYRMQQWRLHLNSKTENDLNGWMSETNKLLHQIDFSKSFYRSYLENLYSTLQRSEQVQKGEFADEPGRAWSTQAIYPYRTLPLYGVKTGVEFKGEKENDLYLRKPWLLQSKQSLYLQKVAAEFKPSVQLDVYSQKKLNTVLAGLLSAIPNEQAKYLVQINDPIRTFQKQFQNDNEFLNREFLSALNELKKQIGNSAPVMDPGAGFSQAYISNSSNLLTAKTASFSLDKGIYRFNKATDLMFYNMICGKNDAFVDEALFSGLNFMPPRISTANPESSALCGRQNATATTDNLYKINLTHKNKDMSTTQFLISNLDQKLIGNIADTDGKSGFNIWWDEKTVPVVQSKLKDLDSRYQTLVASAYKNILDEKSFGDFTLDTYSGWSSRLKGGMLDNMNFELEFYISSLNLILSQQKVSTDNYIDSIITKTQSAKFDSVVIDKNLEKTNPLVFRLLRIKKSYQNLFSMLQNNQSVDFKKIEELNGNLSQSMDSVFSQLKDLEKSENLAPEFKTLFSIKKGLEALEIDLKRYLFMKVNLANRLEIDTSEMNDFLKGQKPQKVHSGARPQSGG